MGSPQHLVRSEVEMPVGGDAAMWRCPQAERVGGRLQLTEKLKTGLTDSFPKVLAAIPCKPSACKCLGSTSLHSNLMHQVSYLQVVR